jgi:hypothetical protein
MNFSGNSVLYVLMVIALILIILFLTGNQVSVG